jgi:tRNA(Ile)-lysidine synthase
MLALAERVDRTILRHSLLPPGARVLVALSGGADSTALACLLVELARGRGFQVVGAAHFNHRLRGASSDEDERFCQRLAAQLGIAWRSASGDAQSFAVSGGLSLEDACRQLRYEFLGRAARELAATHVALGHTRDDQAETVLLQLFRGAGPRGLRAMRPVRGAAAAEDATIGGQVFAECDEARRDPQIVRPVLEVGHADLVGWLNAMGIPFREDESNSDRRFLRNRVRHDVIPFLERTVSASVPRVLARAAAIAAADAEYLDAMARSAFARIAARSSERVEPRSGDQVEPRPPGRPEHSSTDRVELDAAGLAAEPPAIAARVVLLAVGNVPGARFVGFDQVERVLDLVRALVPGPVALPGLTAELRGTQLVIARAAARPPKRAGSSYTGSGVNFQPQVLSIPGEAALPATGWIVSCSLRPWAGAGEPAWPSDGSNRTNRATVDASLVTRLAVRRRRPGDAFRPLGLGGRKKLQDYFVDRKVPRAERDSVPLVVDDRDRIVWVAGHGIDEAFRVRPDTRDVIILELRGESA